MRRQGGSFGFVALLLVLAVILYVAINNFKSVAPAALAVQKHNKDRQASEGIEPEKFEPKNESTAASADAWTPSPPSRPSVNTMDERTSDHSKSVQDALSQAN